MAICRECNEVHIGTGGKPYYRDGICLITDNGSSSIKATFRWHSSPTSMQFSWVELQLKIICRRKWGNDWVMSREMSAPHPHWLAWSIPGKIAFSNDRGYDPQDKTKELG